MCWEWARSLKIHLVGWSFFSGMPLSFSIINIPCFSYQVFIGSFLNIFSFVMQITPFSWLHSSQGWLTGGSVCQTLLKDFWKLHYLFILLPSSTSLHTEVWGNSKRVASRYSNSH
jgi:hypothetical protein